MVLNLACIEFADFKWNVFSCELLPYPGNDVSSNSLKFRNLIFFEWVVKDELGYPNIVVLSDIILEKFLGIKYVVCFWW